MPYPRQQYSPTAPRPPRDPNYRIVETLVRSLTAACAHEAGFGRQIRHGIKPVWERLNNPLCLPRWKDREGQPFPTSNGFVEFPACPRETTCVHPDHPYEIGWSAGRTLVKILIMRGRLSCWEIAAGRPGNFAGFAPLQNGCNARQYAEGIFERLLRETGVQIVETEAGSWPNINTAVVELIPSLGGQSV